jgi:iron complex transport system ATP-binding protein
MTTDGYTIELKGLSFVYGPGIPVVLKNVSGRIPGRAVTALLGPNGSGKTTLLHVLLGLLAHKEGDILVSGKPLGAYSPKEMKRLIGLVPQEESIPFDLSVLEYVLLGRAPHLKLLALPKEEDFRIALDALETIGITALRDRSLPSLSGGERQLVMLARVLTQESAILLLDEPTSHLDLANRRRVLEVMGLLRDMGKTVVFSTHDPNAAAGIADHVLLLRDGRILVAAPVRTAITTRNLSDTYGVEVEVVEMKNRPMVLPF